LTEELVNTYGRRIKNLNLRPGGGGAFEVLYNGKLIFSKKALDRLPEDGEITTLIEANR
jgi:selenoprotein W-related protein